MNYKGWLQGPAWASALDRDPSQVDVPVSTTLKLTHVLDMLSCLGVENKEKGTDTKCICVECRTNTLSEVVKLSEGWFLVGLFNGGTGNPCGKQTDKLIWWARC